MVDLNKILVIIPARKGSKGIPGKNRKRVSGRTLVEHAILCAQIGLPGARIVVSTDDEKIFSLAEKRGVKPPFMRPPRLSRDTTSSLSVINHCLRYLKAQAHFRAELVILLQPTSIFRSPHDLKQVVALLQKHRRATSVISVTAVDPHYNFSWQCRIKGETLRLVDGAPLWKIKKRRQLLPEAYTRNGAIYAIRTGGRPLKNLYGARPMPYVMEPGFSINIDKPADLALARKEYPAYRAKYRKEWKQKL